MTIAKAAGVTNTCQSDKVKVQVSDIVVFQGCTDARKSYLYYLHNEWMEHRPVIGSLIDGAFIQLHRMSSTLSSGLESKIWNSEGDGTTANSYHIPLHKFDGT